MTSNQDAKLLSRLFSLGFIAASFAGGFLSLASSNGSQFAG